jgi:phospholipid/cholesterol/gamma-HCH transport system substrate-binding protein
VEAAVAGASDFVTSLTSIQAHIDLATWYSLNAGTAQVRFGLRLQPRPDKYYLFEVVDDGGGIERFTRTIAGQEDTAITRRTQIREDNNSLRFSAMFAKKFWDFLVLRAGLIETSGGVGANILLWDDRIDLRTDVFNFSGPRNRIGPDDPLFEDVLALPRWRTMLQVQPIPHLYLMAGVDDVLNLHASPAVQGFGFDYFFGAGITFQDDDLRAILPFVPSF